MTFTVTFKVDRQARNTAKVLEPGRRLRMAVFCGRRGHWTSAKQYATTSDRAVLNMDQSDEKNHVAEFALQFWR